MAPILPIRGCTAASPDLPIRALILETTFWASTDAGFGMLVRGDWASRGRPVAPDPSLRAGVAGRGCGHDGVPDRRSVVRFARGRGSTASGRPECRWLCPGPCGRWPLRRSVQFVLWKTHHSCYNQLKAAFVEGASMRSTGSTRVIGVLAVIGGVLLSPMTAAGALQPAQHPRVAMPLRSAPPIGTLRVTLEDPSATPNDIFGSAVARSGDGVGATTVVGAPSFNDRAGAAYIYVKGTSGWPTTPTATLADPAATPFDAFGTRWRRRGTRPSSAHRPTNTPGRRTST